MNPEIITAFTASGSSIICALIVGCFQNWRLKKKYEYQNQQNLEVVKAEIKAQLEITTHQIKQLTEEQKKYNNLQERMVGVETGFKILDERQKVANHRIDDLEEEKSYGKIRKARN